MIDITLQWERRSADIAIVVANWIPDKFAATREFSGMTLFYFSNIFYLIQTHFDRISNNSVLLLLF